MPGSIAVRCRPFSEAAHTQTEDDKEKSKPFPSNLSIDRRSSYAPKRVTRKNKASMVADEDDEEDDDEEEDVDDKEGGKDASTTAAEEDQDEEDDDYYYYSEDDDGDDDAELHFEPPEAIPVIPLPDRLHVPIYNFGGNLAEDEPEEVGTIWLEPSVFGLDPIRVDFLKRAVDYYRAKKRGRRKAHTKRIGDIRGSTRKLRPQKGQGMARVGHKKVGSRRGGAKAHGPTNQTDYGNTKLNKKIRRKAVQHVLAAKLKQGDLILMNQFHNLPTHKTKVLTEWLKPFNIAGRHGTSAFLIDHYYPDENENDDNENDDDNPQATSYNGVPVNLTVASGNLHKVKIGNQLRNLHVYDVLKYDKLVLTLDALTAIEARLKD